MQKVLILSYYYPPSAFVGGERTEYWANHLSDYGLYPIILTRQWNDAQNNLLEKNEQTELKIIKNETHEVHYLPIESTLKNRISHKPHLSYLRKALVFSQFIFGRIHIYLSSHKNFYNYSQDILKKNPDIKLVMASGRPFEMFQVGHSIKNKFDIIWIPDYRDEWNTHQNNEWNNNNIIRKYFSSIEKKSELKWTKNADYFISVSSYWTESIQNFINIPGHVVMNGYQSYSPLPNNSKKDVFSIVYAGTMYAAQPIEMFIEAINQIVQSNRNPELQIEVVFIGTENAIYGHQKLINLTKEYKHYKLLPRMNKEELNMNISQCDLLLLTSFENVKGWYPVKLFEYYATGKPILLIPSDNDVMEEFIRKSGCGYTCNSTIECLDILKELLNNKMSGIQPILNYNHDYAQQYSRKNQTKLLAEFLNTLKI